MLVLTLKFLSCTEIVPGYNYFQADITKECSEGINSAGNLALAIPILIFELLVPLSLLLMLVFKRRKNP